MSRLNIEIPEDFTFSTQIPVLVEHVNYGAHLGNDSYLSILHEARVRFLESLGFSELSVLETIGIVLTDSYISYKKETTRGDVLEIFVKLDNLSRLECDFYYKMVSKNLGVTIALAKTGAAFFDYKKRKLSPLPKHLLEILQNKLK
jgi:acyl-CoA thioester hydrolase